MEEHRIGHMYLNLFKRRILGAWDGVFGRDFRRSSLVLWLAIGALILVPAVGWHLHTRGQFSTLKREIKGEQQSAPVVIPRPGGLDPLILTRPVTAGSTTPEFLTTTLLPGMGMGILQITAYIPNHGEVPLLSAPTLDQMTEVSSLARTGVNDAHGAFEVPWAGGLTGIISPIGMTIATGWKGRTLEVPADPKRGRALSEGGLLSSRGADSFGVTPNPGGGFASGRMQATDFDGHWISKTETTVEVQMSAVAIDLKVTARNVGDQAEPLGIGWHPRFAVSGRDRDNTELRLPVGERLEAADRQKGTYTGRMTAPGPALERFVGHPGRLGTDSLDESLVHLRPALLDHAAGAEFRLPASAYGLRMIAASPSIRVLRVSSPASSSYVSMGMQTNLEDPFGKEWSPEDAGGIDVLLPGQSVEWKVRLEIFPVTSRVSIPAR